MAEKRKQSLQEIPKHDIQVKASVEEPSPLKELCKSAMEEYIVPRTTEMIRDAFGGMISMTADMLRSCVDKLLYPDGNVPNRKPSSNNGYYTGTTNYTSFSRPIVNQYQPANQARNAIGQRPGNAVKYIWVESEEKAKEIIGCLREDIDIYGKAKVATLYEMIHEKITMADFHYGWTDADAIGYYYDSNRRMDENKWFIDLPKPVDITNI